MSSADRPARSPSPADTATVVVRRASNPTHAKILIALLQANDIPAYTDGDALADEFAMSRKLMNAAGVEVRVPAASAERARQVLQDADIPEDELEAQALAADPATAEAAAAAKAAAAGPTPRPSWPAVILLLLLTAGVASGATAWSGGRSATDPHFDYRPASFGLREIDRRTGLLTRELQDLDRDGSYEEIRDFRRDGTLVRRSRDADGDGRHEVSDELLDGVRYEFRDLDGDGVFEQLTIFDRDGKQVRQLHRDGTAGYR